MDGRDEMLTRPNPSRRLGYDDFLLFPDHDGLRHEIIDGEHYVTAAPTVRHQDLLGRLHLSLGAFVEDRPERGRVFLSPCDVVFSFHDIVEPDLIFVGPDQFEILTDKNIQGTPALVIEILSPSTRRRDRGIKRQLYDRSGVREYWLVDPETHAVTIHRRAVDGSFPQAARLTAERLDILATPLLRDWSLELARLFRSTLAE
jgi:Uma2 family endonuclease